jgi:hypothetical protein
VSGLTKLRFPDRQDAPIEIDIAASQVERSRKAQAGGGDQPENRLVDGWSQSAMRGKAPGGVEEIANLHLRVDVWRQATMGAAKDCRLRELGGWIEPRKIPGERSKDIQASRPGKRRGALRLTCCPLPQTQSDWWVDENRVKLEPMLDLCRLIVGIVTDLFRSRAALEAELLVLRQQLNVLRRAAPKRLFFDSIDRLILAAACRSFPKAYDALAIVRPDTVIRHRHPIGALLQDERFLRVGAKDSNQNDPVSWP